MRRTDREVTDRQEILAMLARCGTVRVAMRGGAYPYVVPVSFGAEEAPDGAAVLYFHCAKQGEKLAYLQQDARVCVEADRFLGVQRTAHGITARYESVIGRGMCEPVTDDAEIRRGLQCILAHYGEQSFSLDTCSALSRTCVYRITLTSLTGKRNLPET